MLHQDAGQRTRKKTKLINLMDFMFMRWLHCCATRPKMDTLIGKLCAAQSFPAPASQPANMKVHTKFDETRRKPHNTANVCVRQLRVCG